jgi:hypothetical protein
MEFFTIFCAFHVHLLFHLLLTLAALFLACDGFEYFADGGHNQALVGMSTDPVGNKRC